MVPPLSMSNGFSTSLLLFISGQVVALGHHRAQVGGTTHRDRLSYGSRRVPETMKTTRSPICKHGQILSDICVVV